MLISVVKLKTDFVVLVHPKIGRGGSEGECAVRKAGVWVVDGVVWL